MAFDIAQFRNIQSGTLLVESSRDSVDIIPSFRRCHLVPKCPAVRLVVVEVKVFVVVFIANIVVAVIVAGKALASRNRVRLLELDAGDERRFGESRPVRPPPRVVAR